MGCCASSFPDTEVDLSDFDSTEVVPNPMRGRARPLTPRPEVECRAIRDPPPRRPKKGLAKDTKNKKASKPAASASTLRPWVLEAYLTQKAESTRVV